MIKMTKSIGDLLQPASFNVMKRYFLDALRRSTERRKGAKRDRAFLSAMPAPMTGDLLALLPESRAQLRQDLLALSTCGFKRNGYFVEFGATDGVELSNTYLLEKRFGWKGVLAEPAKVWHTALRKNRVASIDTRCVWSKSGDVVRFRETDVGAFSTVDNYSSMDEHAAIRSKGHIYDVQTVSLADLLEEHGAPREIDFLSIDTEGSEYDILRAFDFSRYRFRLIVCEHNYTSTREKIFTHLGSRGYKRIFDELSRWDDWYISDDLVGIFDPKA